MKTRVGRNPFDGPAPRKARITEEIVFEASREASGAAPPAEEARSPIITALAKWLFVDFRAEAYVVALKTAMLTFAVFDTNT